MAPNFIRFGLQISEWLRIGLWSWQGFFLRHKLSSFQEFSSVKTSGMPPETFADMREKRKIRSDQCMKGEDERERSALN